MLSFLNISDQDPNVGFFRSWVEIVGIDLAAHTRVRDIRAGVLVVHVDHPGWLQRFQMQEERILKHVSERFPSLEIRHIHLHYRKDFEMAIPGSPATDSHQQTPPEVSGLPTNRETEEHTDDPPLHSDLAQALERLRRSIIDRSSS